MDYMFIAMIWDSTIRPQRGHIYVQGSLFNRHLSSINVWPF